MLTQTHVYLLVINPNGTVEQKTEDIKYLFGHDYDCIEARNRPHITLSNFLLVGKQMEEQMLRYFRHFFSLRKSFDVEIDGFDHFSHHTIFLKVSTGESILKMSKGLRTKFRRHLMPHKSLPPFFCKTPHLTIAKGMQKEQFDKAWPVWHDHKFKAGFNVNEVVLIKRQYPGTDKYEEVERFNLNGLWEDAEQLRLPF